jgi:hypothetical protein
MKAANKFKTGEGGKSKMKKVEKVKQTVMKNTFGFKEGSNRAFISDMFLENGIKLQDAAKKVAKKLDKDETKATSIVLGMVKRLLKKGHKIEVLITTTQKKNDAAKKGKNGAKIAFEKGEVVSVKEYKGESGEENLQDQPATA